MSTKTKFWNDTAQYIANNTNGIPPKNWTKSEIDPFLHHFYQQLKQRCTENTSLIEACSWQQPKDGQAPSGSTISYDSFRRIFITKKSMGNRTTRNMFAIYMGYTSYDDYFCQNNAAPAPDTSPLARQEVHKWHADAQPLIQKNISTKGKQQLILWKVLAIVSGLVLSFFLMAYHTSVLFSPSNPPLLQEPPKLIFRNDNGIGIISTSGDEPIQVVSNRRYLTGFDYDPEHWLLFWSNSNSNKSYLGVSYVQPDSMFHEIVLGSLKRQVISEVKYPAGIALDIDQKLVYCADYGNSTVKVFDYQGLLLESDLVKGLSGATSSVELDLKHQQLYWTEVSNHKIGKFDLQTKEGTPNFIINAGIYPDGLSIDPIHNRLYWSSSASMEIGMAELPTGISKLIKVNIPPAAVEVHATEQLLYFSALQSDVIRIGRITTDSILFQAEAPLLFTFGSLPSVLKIVY